MLHTTLSRNIWSLQQQPPLCIRDSIVTCCVNYKQLNAQTVKDFYASPIDGNDAQQAARFGQGTVRSGDLETFCRRSPPPGNVLEPKHLFASFLSFLKCACNSNSHSYPTRAPESILPPATSIFHLGLTTTLCRSCSLAQMDMEPSTEDLRSQVLQNTLQQISSLAGGGAAKCCVICLGDLVEQCEAQPCRHNNFDYLCLITWLQEQATCPLCKSDVREVRYELGEDGKQGKVYKLKGRSGGPDSSNGLAEEGWSRSVYEDETIQRRRFVYRHNLYSLHVGSNRRQPAASRYRELSPQLFMTDPELVSRARMWLRRELRVFEFLYADGDSPYDHDPVRRRRACNAEFLLEYTVAILKTMDIQGSAGQAEDIIQEFLGRKNTRLFLHELKAWLRSPYGSLSAWDRVVQYDGGNTMPRASQNVGRESGIATPRVSGLNSDAIPINDDLRLGRNEQANN